jgi:hypothetical protein
LPLLKGTSKAIFKIKRTYIREASDKVYGGKWIVKWNVVCAPKNMGGLGILDLEN